MVLYPIFIDVDDFYKSDENKYKNILKPKKNEKKSKKKTRAREFNMHISEIATIIIYFHYSGFHTFKWYYKKKVLIDLQSEFPNLVSYSRIIELKQLITTFLKDYALFQASKNTFEKKYIDSFPLKACNLKREKSHKTMKRFAKKGKTSTGFFYGSKLHATFTIDGKLSNFKITPGNVSDANNNVINEICSDNPSKFYGDKGYILGSKTREILQEKKIEFITKVRSNMKPKILNPEDAFFLKKRGTVESIGDILKNSLLMEHTRHRSMTGFFCHVFSTLSAYLFYEKTPSALARESFS